MRKPLIALALSAAAAATGAGSVIAGTGAAGATPIACPELPRTASTVRCAPSRRRSRASPGR
ncbi:hypothetical protein [Tsukamurella sp. PLM1]|uniref:hypothetical protein n=1 Tax=Tsukamurella sp. PLM1 TaxID=2929795 RepID=UPI002047B3EB|nr:hypothetical protein [Tsukamurella sp. PLM1]BDH57822.1 hypothetical protein MTP03_27610 [Tsukamurella sp. PLM1]